MSLRPNKNRALEILMREAVEEANGAEIDVAWGRRIATLSLACEAVGIRTYVAMLGTALLAKATDLRVDPFALKEKASTSGAYSARSLGHGVLVANAPILGIHLGTTGREPLNNQPFFRLDRVESAAMLDIVKGPARELVGLLIEALGALDVIGTEKNARLALRAFIRVRRAYQPDYGKAPNCHSKLTGKQFVDVITDFVSATSEGGRRAQAVVAGLLDVFSGADRVVVGRINDPDRHLPGDVGVRPVAEIVGFDWERVFEVRDKVVRTTDLLMFTRKCAENRVKRAGVVAVSSRQQRIVTEESEAYAQLHHVAIETFIGWNRLTMECLFWGTEPVGAAISTAIQRIRVRLIGIEASEDAVALWDKMTSP